MAQPAPARVDSLGMWSKDLRERLAYWSRHASHSRMRDDLSAAAAALEKLGYIGDGSEFSMRGK